jgi:hypothetical protein
MPNGESKNWIRFIITLESFYGLYGNWPSTIHLYPFFIEEIEKKLSPEDFQHLQSKLTIIADEGNPYLALDAAGNRFDYTMGKPSPPRDVLIKAIDWLEINEPDYYD